MRHKKSGYKLSRTTNERKQLFRGLVRELILHGKITTTLPKAKSIQPLIEQLITKGKIGTEAKRREILSVVSDKQATRVIIKYSKDVFAKRQSGFTRIVKMGPRKGDNAEEAMLLFVDELPKEEEKEKKTKKKKKASAQKEGKDKKETNKKEEKKEKKTK